MFLDKNPNTSTKAPAAKLTGEETPLHWLNLLPLVISHSVTFCFDFLHTCILECTCISSFCGSVKKSLRIWSLRKLVSQLFSAFVGVRESLWKAVRRRRRGRGSWVLVSAELLPKTPQGELCKFVLKLIREKFRSVRCFCQIVVGWGNHKDETKPLSSTIENLGKNLVLLAV